MAYAQIDDLFADHPKVAGLSDAAFRLHVAGILHCSRLLTDGLVDADEVPRLVRRYRKAALAELVDRCLWSWVLDGAYVIHDYLDWNPSREQVEERRKNARKRKIEWEGRRGA